MVSSKRVNFCYKKDEEKEVITLYLDTQILTGDLVSTI